MRQRGELPGDARELWLLDPTLVEKGATLETLVREGAVWIIKPQAKSEEDAMQELLKLAAPCHWST